jgi:alkanesulfonate monooxygenase SsuD/methylene tetrahydromethanopterin reductase-like flavin-dependent oxidoreductase (luciferase family)
VADPDRAGHGHDEDPPRSARQPEELDPVWRDDTYRITGATRPVLDQLRAFVQAGVHGFIVQFPAPFDFETLERLAGEVRAELDLER